MTAPQQSAFYRYAKYSAVPFEFLGCIAAGVFVGRALDAWLQTEPWLVLGMTIAGTVIGFYRMVQILQRLRHLS
jgi:F0F1-type ATP synthase assembly protein I